MGGTTGVRLHPDRLDLPLRWRKPRRIFVTSLSDLFHEEVPNEFISFVFAVASMCPQHTFQILTKRPERMAAYLNQMASDPDGYVFAWAHEAPNVFLDGRPAPPPIETWPLPNVWLGVSVENQRMADERIPLLLDTPAALRFVSVEPLLADVDLSEYLPESQDPTFNCGGCEVCGYAGDGPFIDWVIAGGETQGPAHRHMKLEWAASLRDQCLAANVPFFFKQTSGPRPGMGRDALDGVVWSQMPEGLGAHG